MSEQLCNINDIEDPGSMGFKFKQGRRERLVFVVKKDGNVYAYENECPHAGINLEWQEHDFLDNDKQHIQCSVHGALFNIENGDCMGGACNGEGLTQAEIQVDDQGNISLVD